MGFASHVGGGGGAGKGGGGRGGELQHGDSSESLCKVYLLFFD